MANDIEYQHFTSCNTSGVRFQLSYHSIGKRTSYCLIVCEYASEKLFILQKMALVYRLFDREVVADTVITNAQIVGVPLRLRCKARVEPSTPRFGRCSKPECAMMQHYDVCQEQLSAKLLFMTNSNFVSLYAYLFLPV